MVLELSKLAVSYYFIRQIRVCVLYGAFSSLAD
jgi:hypothetical protein